MAEDLRFVENGVELMDYLHRRGRYSDPLDAPRPSVIFLDLRMPKRDGREALADIKADPDLRLIRVVVLTTSQAQEDIHGTYALGAASYIIKPARYESLADVVRTLAHYWLELVELPSVGNGS